jgi:hypothetical protein
MENNACLEGLRCGEENRAINCNRPKTTEELYQVLQEYAQGEDGDIAKKNPPRHNLEASSSD